MKRIIKAIPYIISIITIVTLSCIFYFPQLQKKSLTQSDMTSHTGMSHEVIEYQKKSEAKVVGWTNAMFGGMPSYKIGGVPQRSILGHGRRILSLGFSDPIGSLIMIMICSFISLMSIGISPWISLIISCALGLTSNHIILWEAGHVTKLWTLAFSSLIISGMIVLFQRKYLIGFSLFAFGLSMSIRSGHIQMTYYLGLSLALFYLVNAIYAIRNRKFKHLTFTSLILLIGIILAAGSNYTELYINNVYAEDTMRGKPILENVVTSTPTSSSETDGLEWNYAMSWSAGNMDVLAGFIPGIVGGSSSERVGSNTELANDLRRKGVNVNRNFRAPMYWGDLLFTAGPVYFGILLVLLFGLSFVFLKGPLFWGLVASLIVTILISLGSNAAWVNRNLFDFLPLFNKFRAPVSMLGITAFLLATIGALSLQQIYTTSKKKVRSKKSKKLITYKFKKKHFIAAGVIVSIPLLIAILGLFLFDFTSSGDDRLVQAGYSLDALVQDRKSYLMADSFRTLILSIILLAALWIMLSKKVKAFYLLIAIGLIAILDLWSIDRRYVKNSDFQRPRTSDINADQYIERDVDKQIFAAEPNGRGYYRVLDLSINTFNSAQTSYFHNTIGGYHPAKLQRYQDLIDRFISKNNISVLSMLNTKYIIDQNQQLQQNLQALGNAWFVEDIIKVSTANEEIEALNRINPATIAVVYDSEFNNYIGDFNPSKNGEVSLVKYEPIRLEYRASTNSEQLAVFSEMWYGPDKGWQASIDGEKVEHIRCNYALRALKIPSGEHSIIFEFYPAGYDRSESISKASSWLILLLILGSLGWNYYGKRKYNTS